MEYSLKKNRRSKTIRITVHPDGRVVVSVPYRVPSLLAHQFVRMKERWIQERILFFEQREKERLAQGLPKRLTLGENKKEYEQLKTQAQEILEKRVRELNTLYGFMYTGITTRNQKTRWGSCSTKGTLSFNYKVAFLPQEMMDYVIVHELCHLREFNHSQKFFDLVAHAVPDYRLIRRNMKRMTH